LSALLRRPSPATETTRMARLAVAGLAFLLPQSQALIHSQRSEGDNLDDCKCLNWADVYKGHNVTCGAGMELFWAMDSMNSGIDNRVRYKMTLGSASAAASAALQKLKGSEAYASFCTDFFEKASFNYCVNKRFLTEPDKVEISKGTWCYVSNKCRLPLSSAVPGTDLTAKQCTESLDPSLGSLAVEDVVKLAVEQGLDQIMLAGHAYLFKPVMVEELSENQLRDLKDRSRPTIVFSMKDATAPRWVVERESIYEYLYDADHPQHWKVTCKSGCTSQ